MAKYQHSVSLNPEKCCGCTHCLKRCPTEAIRIREGHAQIDPARCIDCGECIRVCPHKAKKAVCDKFSDIPEGKYKIALPAPTLCGQFDNLDDIDYLLQGLLDLGFDEVYEVARAAEIVSDYTRRYMKRTDIPKPVISSACPVISRLISLRYPFLVENLLPILSPMEVAAKEAREGALAKHPELSDSDIFVVFISPCPAKVSFVKNKPDHGTGVDLVVSISDVYFDLLGVMKKEMTAVPVSKVGMIGLSWASASGEATAIFNDHYLAADGIENANKVLEEIDNGSFPDLEFVELNACPGGCVGGVMTVANPYIAQTRIFSLRRYLPVSQNRAEESGIPDRMLGEAVAAEEYKSPSALSADRAESMMMLGKMEEIYSGLPKIDCGSCGAPNCRAFALDVVKGKSDISECVVFMREELKKLHDKIQNLTNDGDL